MGRLAVLIALSGVLAGCAQTLAVAPVESVLPPPPALPKEAPPPVLDAVPTDQIDVVSTSDHPAEAAAIEVTFRHSDTCEYGPCRMRIWRDGLVSFVNERGARGPHVIGWSRVRSSDVSRWLAKAESTVPPPKTSHGRQYGCRTYYFMTYADITFHTGDRKVSIRANDPCSSQATQAIVAELVNAAPLPEPKH